MSSAGQVLGGIVGAVAGFFMGGPAGALQGAMWGMGIGGMIDPPKGPSVIGPRLSDLTTQTSTYGAVIPRVYGTVPILGNVFWLENNTIKETSTTTTQGGKGGGGQEVTTFSYSATFAVGLCEGPIAGVRRIWIGPKLIYDAGATDVASVIASNQKSSLFHIYLGDDTQLPDARMQATLGVNNTPAYRGLAYIVFYDLALKDYQNSLMGAQVKVEVVASGAVSTLVSNLAITPNYQTAYNPEWNISAPYISDTSSIIIYVGQWDSTYSGYGVKVYMLMGNTVVKIGDMTAISNQPFANGVSDVPGFLNTTTVNGNLNWQSLTQSINLIIPENFGQSQISYVKSGGDFFIGSTLFGSKTIYKRGSSNAQSAPLSNYATLAVDATYVYCLEMSTPGRLTRLLRSDLTFVDATTLDFTPSIYTSKIRVLDNGGVYILDNNYIKYISGGISTILFSGTGTSSSGSNPYFSVINGGSSALVFNFQDSVTGRFAAAKIYTKSIAQTRPLLSTIVSAECLKSNLLAAPDIDVTALTQTVRGYRVSTVSAIRGSFDPLIGSWPFDVIQSGYKIVFKPRGGASVVTIPVAKLDARGIGQSPGVQITNSREMDLVLPNKVSLKYLDNDREYDTGEQYAERLNTQSVNTRSMELPLVLTADEAAQKAEILLYLYWLERYDVAFKLPPEYNYLEPSDVITVTTSDASYQLRLTAINYTSDGRLECQAKYNNAATYTSTASGGAGAAVGQTLSLAGATQYELLDIPLLQDAFDMSGFPVAMSGYLSGWPGGMLMRSDDNAQTWAQVQGFAKPGTNMGYASNSLSVHNGLLIDKSSALTVIVGQALSSVTELQMLNGSNHFAYGLDGRWEIIAAKNCVLQADGSYILTDLLRGRFGSEWATGLHAANDHIMLLDKTTLQFEAVNLNTIGLSRSYRGITLGKTIDTDSNRAFTYNGVNLKCLSPVYLNGNRSAANDWTLTWVRRTRKGGELRDLVDAPLSEASESYSMDIFADGTYAVVKRTLTAATPTLTYTSANQVTDFGSNQSTLYIKLYQISSNTGRGYPLTTSITR